MRLENYEDKTLLKTNIWKLNNMQLTNQWITEEIKQEIKKYLKTNEKENTMIQNLRDKAKVMLRGELIAIKAYHKQKSQINYLILHLRELEKKRNN